MYNIDVTETEYRREVAAYPDDLRAIASLSTMPPFDGFTRQQANAAWKAGLYLTSDRPDAMLFHAALGTSELFTRSPFPAHVVKKTVSPIYSIPRGRERDRATREILRDMDTGDLPDDWLEHRILDGDARHLLLELVELATTRGHAINCKHIEVPITRNELLRTLNWGTGGAQGDRLRAALKKIAFNEYLLRHADGKRTYGLGLLMGEFSDWTGTGDSAGAGSSLLISRKLVEWTKEKQFYKISLPLLRALEANREQVRELEAAGLVNPYVRLLTPRVRRMMKALYISVKIMGPYARTAPWQFWYHLTGEGAIISGNRREARRKLKTDVMTALKFLRDMGQVDLKYDPRDSRLREITAGKSERLKKLEQIISGHAVDVDGDDITTEGASA